MKKSLVMLAALSAMGASAGAAFARRSVDKESFGHERRDLGTHMILDTQLQLSSAQSLINGVGDLVSTNYYDTGAAQDEGIGEEVEILVQLGTAVTSGGAGTLQLVLQTDTASNFATSLTEFPLTAALALAALTANTVLYKGRLPYGMKRYVRLVWRIGTAALTAGTGSAQLLMNVDAQQYLAKNFTVS